MVKSFARLVFIACWMVVSAGAGLAQLPPSSGIVINQTPVMGGTTTDCLFVNGNVVGQQPCGGAQYNWIPRFSASMSSGAATPTAPGSGYVAGDVITLATTGGTCSTAPTVTVLTVSTGAVANWAVNNQGVCTVVPTQPMTQASTTGIGTGATFTLTFDPIASNVLFPTASIFTGNQNTVRLGNGAAPSVTTGNQLTAIGTNACLGVTTGNENTCLGQQAGGQQNGSFNVFVGGAGVALAGTGNNNTVVGDTALRNATNAVSMTLMGAGSAKDLTVGTAAGWTGFGENTFQHNLNGNSTNNSSAFGRSACTGANGTASFRGITCLGANTGGALTSAINSLLIGGSGAGNVGNATMATGSGVILIGSGNVTVDTPASGTSSYINIENIITATGTGTPSTSLVTLAGNLAVTAMTQTAVAQSGTVCYNSGTGAVTYDATLGCLASVASVKTDIVTISGKDALAEVVALRPVSFRYRDGLNLPADLQIGLIADEVAQVDSRMVGYGPDGELRGVRYAQSTALLIGAVQQLKADNDNMRAELQILKRARR